jgi:DNA invertase Pin-like site-specific DNA recombinase
MKKRVLGLIRVSTDQQDVRRQRADMEKLKKRFDLEIIRILEMVGLSGMATLNDAEVQQVLHEVQQSGVDGLCVSSIDRIFRPKRFGDFGILNGFQDAHKAIWSQKEGYIEPWTDDGFNRLMAAGSQAGAEWREIRRRTIDGKNALRAEGRHVSGNQSLPKGLRYDKQAGWSYDESELGKVKQAYQLLFEGVNLAAICRRVGWRPTRAKRTLENPSWKGIRIYPPTPERPEAIEVPLDGLAPVLSPEDWDRAQSILATKKTWTKETRVQKFIAIDILFCQCGRKLYTHGDCRRARHDVYLCSSRHPSGRGCGARNLRREVVEAAVLNIVEQHLTDAKFMRAQLRQLEQQTPVADLRAKRETELARLNAKRARLLDALEDGLISKVDFAERAAKIQDQIREAQASMPATPPPVLDGPRVIAALARVFARFHAWEVPQQRTMLKRAIRCIRVIDDSFREVTVSGAFLHEISRAKIDPRCSSPEMSRIDALLAPRSRGKSSPRGLTRVPPRAASIRFIWERRRRNWRRRWDLRIHDIGRPGDAGKRGGERRRLPVFRRR